MEKKGYLLLEDGKRYEGVLRGADAVATGEAVFLTSVVGYMETLTDPAYAGQIVVQTFPQIGNYGVVPLAGDVKEPALSGYVCRELCDEPSNFRCQGTLEAYLREKGVPCLTGVDTRAITRHLRDCGTMKAAILTELPEDTAAFFKALPEAKNAHALSVQETLPAQGEGKYHVAMWDLGAAADTKAQLEARGCIVTTVPASIQAEDVLAIGADGVVITNGPGDPESHEAIAAQIALVCQKHLPMMGIGLGHQLMAIGQGAATVKLHAGHRGGNQPIEDVKTGACYTTTQNHGYAVDVDGLPANASLRFINRNDGSCEGVDYMDMPAFSVQFQPAISGGPLDTRFLFDRFTALMGGNKECR